MRVQHARGGAGIDQPVRCQAAGPDRCAGLLEGGVGRRGARPDVLAQEGQRVGPEVESNRVVAPASSPQPFHRFMCFSRF